MPIKNNVVVGVLVGLILPSLAYFFSEIIFKQEIVAGKPGVPYLIAVGINLILLKYIYRADADKAGKGLLIITFIVFLLTFLLKIKLH